MGRRAETARSGDDAIRGWRPAGTDGSQAGPADVARLFRRAEGWPVAIYLAGLSLRGQRDAGRAVARFAGDDRLVVDYVRDDFLAGLSRRKLEFLTRTSVLDTLAGPVCDAVLERSGSAQVLRELARSNTLLVPLDRSDGAYRYHPLFAEMLEAELRHREPESEPRAAPPGERLVRRQPGLQPGDRAQHRGGGRRACGRADLRQPLRPSQPRQPRHHPELAAPLQRRAARHLTAALPGGGHGGPGEWRRCPRRTLGKNRGQSAG